MRPRQHPSRTAPAKSTPQINAYTKIAFLFDNACSVGPGPTSRRPASSLTGLATNLANGASVEHPNQKSYGFRPPFKAISNSAWLNGFEMKPSIRAGAARSRDSASVYALITRQGMSKRFRISIAASMPSRSPLKRISIRTKSGSSSPANATARSAVPARESRATSQRVSMSELGQQLTSAPRNDYVSSEPVSGRLSGARYAVDVRTRVPHIGSHLVRTEGGSSNLRKPYILWAF